jgi:hypothetical protein
MEIDFEKWWADNYKHLSLGFHSKGDVQLGFNAALKLVEAGRITGGQAQELPTCAECVHMRAAQSAADMRNCQLCAVGSSFERRSL